MGAVGEKRPELGSGIRDDFSDGFGWRERVLRLKMKFFLWWWNLEVV